MIYKLKKNFVFVPCGTQLFVLFLLKKPIVYNNADVDGDDVSQIVVATTDHRCCSSIVNPSLKSLAPPLKTVVDVVNDDDSVALIGIVVVVRATQIIGVVARITEVDVRGEEEAIVVRGDKGTIEGTVEVVDAAQICSSTADYPVSEVTSRLLQFFKFHPSRYLH